MIHLKSYTTDEKLHDPLQGGSLFFLRTLGILLLNLMANSTFILCNFIEEKDLEKIKTITRTMINSELIQIIDFKRITNTQNILVSPFADIHNI